MLGIAVISPVSRRWILGFRRELFCSITPSARPFPEPILRPQPTAVKNLYFGFLGLEPLDSDKLSASKNVLSQPDFL
jgi:hypothetical protein